MKIKSKRKRKRVSLKKKPLEGTSHTERGKEKGTLKEKLLEDTSHTDSEPMVSFSLWVARLAL